MIVQYHKIALAATFGLAMAFTLSCSSGGDDTPPNGGGKGALFNENSQIYNMNNTPYNGSGIIKLYVRDEGEDKIIENAGSVTSGIINLNLPSSIPNEYLEDFFDDESQSSCTSYPKGLKSFFDDDMFVLTDNNGRYIGTLYLGSVEDKEYIFAAYFSKAGKITCNLEEHGFPTVYNIDAKVGWNALYYSRQAGNEGFSTNNILKKEKDIKWIIYLE